MKNILKIENITKDCTIASKKVIALSKSLKVQDEILGVVGESGSGKTTLGRLILGLVRPSNGEIFYNDKNISTKRNILYIAKIFKSF